MELQHVFSCSSIQRTGTLPAFLYVMLGPASVGDVERVHSHAHKDLSRTELLSEVLSHCGSNSLAIMLVVLLYILIIVYIYIDLYITVYYPRLY